jgi:hypothetical protein
MVKTFAKGILHVSLGRVTSAVNERWQSRVPLCSRHHVRTLRVSVCFHAQHTGMPKLKQ